MNGPGPGDSVAIDATAVHPTSGGAGTYLRELVAALPGAGVHPLLLARRNDATAWSGAASVHRVGPSRRPVRLAWEQHAMIRELRRVGPDVTVLHSPHYTMPERVPPGLARVVTIHDLTMLTRPQDHQRVKRWLFARAVRVAAERADALICVSAATAEALTDRLRVKAAVHVVPHGVDTSRFSPGVLPSDDEIRRRLGLERPYILHLGTIEPRKRIDILMRAYERLRRTDVDLVLAGGAWPGVREQLPRISPPARHLGFVPEGDVPALLRGAALVAYPSAEEGFGLPILEALACGCAVVTTAGGATEEVAGGAAILFDVPKGAAGTESAVRSSETSPPAALIESLIESLTAALEAGLAGDGPGIAQRLEAASRRTWAATAAGHAAVYRSLV